MRLSPTILGGLSITAATTFVAKTARAASTDEPLYNEDGMCPDRHGTIVATLIDSFGEENCVYNTDDDSIRWIECDYCFDRIEYFGCNICDPIGPTQPQPVHARYEYHADGGDHGDWKPAHLFVDDGRGYTWVDFLEIRTTDWEVEDIADGTWLCMYEEEKLPGIKRNRLDPDFGGGPTCIDTPETPTAAPNELTPQPSSWFPSTTPVEHYHPDYGCPDRHSGVKGWLYESFGRENCASIAVNETAGYLECEYNNPNGDQGYAKYEYRSTKDEEPYIQVYHVYWKPIRLVASYTNRGAVTVLFDVDTPPANGENCIDYGEAGSFLNGIERKREIASDPSIDELTPTEQPSSWFPSSVPVDGYNPAYGCPDRHDGTVTILYETFGRENCAFIAVSENVRYLECEYLDADFFRGYAKYEYHSTKDEPSFIQYYHTSWKPIELVVTDTDVYGDSGMAPVYFEFDTPPANGDNCIESEARAFLYGIRRKRFNPEDAPTCGDVEGEFTIRVRGQNKVRTCDDYWRKSWKERRVKCKKYSVVESSCPGICLKFDTFANNRPCECKDNPFMFGKTGKESTCAMLEEYGETKRKRKCKKNKFKYNCPSICSKSCEKVI